MVAPRTTCAGVLAVAALSGCSETPRTEVLVVVDSDLSVPDEIEAVEITVTAPDGEERRSMADLRRQGLPRTLALVHEEGPTGPFTVVAEGRLDTATAVRRTARFRFQPERTLVLRMMLLGRCATRSCNADETCAEEGCRSVDVAPDELEPWTGEVPGLDGGAPPDDGGPRDAGPDTGMPADAGPDTGMPADAGPDAGSVDGGCTPSPEQCNMMDDDCDGDVDEDFDLSSDPDNCGTCSNACDFANGTGSCTAGSCVLASCMAGFDDCDGNGANGCEADVTSDRGNCGACGVVCDPGRICCGSMCRRNSDCP